MCSTRPTTTTSRPGPGLRRAPQKFQCVSYCLFLASECSSILPTYYYPSLLPVAAADAKLLHDVLVDPRREGEGRAEAQRHRQPGDVRAGEDERQHGGAIPTIAKVGPVPVQVVEGGRGDREGDDPKGQLGEDVRQRSGDPVCAYHGKRQRVSGVLGTVCHGPAYTS